MLKAYPNPYHDVVNFQIVSPISGKAILEVYNSLGQKLGVAYNGPVIDGHAYTVNYKVREATRGSIAYKLSVGKLNLYRHSNTGK